MSNILSIRRVRVQTLNESGEPEGDPTYGVMAADSYEQAYIDIFDSFEQLTQAIQDAGGIMQVVAAGDQFTDLDHSQYGTDNYYGAANPQDYTDVDFTDVTEQEQQSQEVSEPPEAPAVGRRRLLQRYLDNQTPAGWQELVESILKQGVELRAVDAASGESFTCGVLLERNGLAVGMVGLGLCEMQTGFGHVIYCESYAGTPRLVVWPDINKQDGTVIDLSGARESERKETCGYCGGNCPNDEDNCCDGYSGDVDNLYAVSGVEED